VHDFLKRIPLFADLSAPDLHALSQVSDEIHLAAGDELFAEGSPGDCAYLIKEGEIHIFKATGASEVLLAVRQPGEVLGEMALLETAPRMASARAGAESVLLAIEQAQFNRLLATNAGLAGALFRTVIARWRSTEATLRQREKLAQLGTLSAGVAHELNNPAAAVQRSAAQLQEVFVYQQQVQTQLYALGLTPDQLQTLARLAAQVQQQSQPSGLVDALAQSDRVYALETALEGLRVAEAWEVAPTLAQLGYTPDQVPGLTKCFSAGQLEPILAWLHASHQVYQLLAEMGEGARRITGIVQAMKSYTYLDQAPVQAVDLHEGLDNTLVLLRHKMRGVTVHRRYAPELPLIQAHGSELNQVWTNLIDNAIDALNGQGSITLRTYQADERVVVEIEDDGPGIPPEIQARIFDPFFTTKAPGQGTGLGLHISYNIVTNLQRGELTVTSQPGQTRFSARLPMQLQQEAGSERKKGRANSL
jgi:signal transduction histidine kinase